MYGSALIAKLVVHIDHESVADRGLDARKWPLSIDSNDWSCVKTVRVSKDPSDMEVVCASLGSREA